MSETVVPFLSDLSQSQAIVSISAFSQGVHRDARVSGILITFWTVD